MTRGKVQPIHYDKETVKELTKQITIAGFIGAAKGALVSITSALILTRISPMFKAVRLPVKMFYHSALITTGVIFACEAQLNKFQVQYYQNELERRQKLLDEAADNGIFLDENFISKSVITDDQGHASK